jgi:hypothetical protein
MTRHAICSEIETGYTGRRSADASGVWASRRPSSPPQPLAECRRFTEPHAERLIGSIRRKCLDHVIVLNEDHPRRVLRRYFTYYDRGRTHLSLDIDCPHGRPIQPPQVGDVVEVAEVGGLHHHYEGRAA